jgi:hypothetical protein
LENSAENTESNFDEPIDATQAKKIEEKLSFMKVRSINTASDRIDLLEAMKFTMIYRKKWIFDTKPSLTDILNNFPKIKEMPFVVSIY